MKELMLISSIVLFATMCSVGQNKAHGSSKDLEKDTKNSTGYNEALDIFQSADRATLLKKTDRAVDNLVHTTIDELKKRGHMALAGSIQMDYETRFHGFVYSFKPGRDVGDHEAIAWLKKIHEDIHSVLGDQLCRALRLHDLWVLAYTIPVVFSCEDNVDYPEYYKHYSPFLGVVAYWVSYGTCAIASMGMGSGVVFLCGLVGMGCEVATTQLIVPLTCKGAYGKACD